MSYLYNKTQENCAKRSFYIITFFSSTRNPIETLRTNIKRQLPRFVKQMSHLQTMCLTRYFMPSLMACSNEGAKLKRG